MKPELRITDRCIKCDNCTLVCPENAIINNDGLYTVEIWSCTLCNICTQVCPADCIVLEHVEDNN